MRRCDRVQTTRDSITYHPSWPESLHGRVIEAINECSQCVKVMEQQTLLAVAMKRYEFDLFAIALVACEGLTSNVHERP